MEKIQLTNLNLDDLRYAQHKLQQYDAIVLSGIAACAILVCDHLHPMKYSIDTCDYWVADLIDSYFLARAMSLT